ncbi:DUF6470 family protein [Pontibacillus litoralis]|uniref:Uncharacterized protein n=1 Tax=Pontibacillus litoralis JSM 072002 TaxID=1385512 RepID=A0A0A5HRQ4_9BACI|nr:DUF6470 family protein [Pontibacillus litoralis]KGX86312.1 hypothetical protein N784_05020 [Pontibacillus litoralis JSM 072002]
MNFPQMQIRTTDAKLGLQTRNATLKMEQPQAEMRIEQPQADQSMKQHPSKLTIDQTNAWHNLDLKGILKRSEDFAAFGKQSVLEGIAKDAQEGDELMRIENGGNPIANQAERNSILRFDMQPGGIPVHKLVSIQYEPGSAEIHTEPNKPVIEITPQQPRLTYERGNVFMQMEQYPSVELDVKGLTFKGTQGFEITI